MRLRVSKTAAMVTLAGVMLWQNGCSSSSPNTILDTVTPSAATVIAGTVQTFTSTVTGTDTTTSQFTCTYVYTPAPTTAQPNPVQTSPATCTSGQTVNGGSIGTWTDTPTAPSNVLTYTAPSLSNLPNPIPVITFTATADADKKKTGTALVGLDSGIRVAITPTSATVPVGLNPAGAVSFSAQFLNSPPTNASWAVMQPVAGDTTDFPPSGTASPLGASCSPNCGSITASGPVATFTAPATMPNDTFPKSSGSNAATAATSVIVVAWSPSDTAHYAIAQITLVNASTNPITFTGIHPTTVAAGGALQDIWLDAKNILNTTPISITLPNGQTQTIQSTNIFTVPITSSYCTPSAANVTPVVSCDASIETRIRLNSAQLAIPGAAQITVSNIPNGGQTQAISFPLNIVYAPPALVSAVPDSYSQNTSATLQADGGYFGSSGNPLTELLFNGQLTPKDQLTSTTRQIVGPLEASATNTPGLYPVSVAWQGSTPPSAPPFPLVTTNVAVQPIFSELSAAYFSGITPPTPTGKTVPYIPLPPMGAVTNLVPSSIAVNSNKGYAVITEQGANAVQVVQLAPSGSRYAPVAVGSPVAVGNQPTSVAIDDQINLSPLNSSFAGQDLAVVVNTGDGTLSLLAVSASGATPISTVSLNGLVAGVNSPPFSVGIDPTTHYAIVAFANNATLGFIVDVNPLPHTQTCFSTGSAQSPPCAINTVSLNTGTSPQVIMQPNVPLGYVTPGGAGVTSVVNLLLTDNSVSIAAAPNGLVRDSTGQTVTVTTPTSNGLNPSTPGAVLIAGATPDGF